MTVEEFNETVDLYADTIYRFILGNIRNKEKAHDIVQDSFEKMWMKVHQVKAEHCDS